MTNTTTAGPTLRAWARARKSAFGRWLFARTVSRRAPYFGTIKPAFLDLEPRLCRVSMKKRRAVENHIGTVHALAMGNLCELAAGMCTEVTIPVGMRWIPRGMTIEYLAKAETDVMATARLDKTEWTGPENVGVPVTVTDAARQGSRARGHQHVRVAETARLRPRLDPVCAHSEQTSRRRKAQHSPAMSGPSPAQRASLARFAKSSLPRALWQLAQHSADFPGSVGCHGLELVMPDGVTAWTLLLAVPTAALYVRLFILQHDCSHGSFFASARANRWLGAGLGVAHAVPVRVLEEDPRRASRHVRQSRPARARRHPHAHGGRVPRLVALDAFLLPLLSQHAGDARHRALSTSSSPSIGCRSACRGRWKKEWRSVALNNLALLAVGWLLCLLLDWRTLLAVHLPVVVIAGAFGVWLFYVQHSFEEGYWVRSAEWDPHAAAVDGSSFYDLPPVLRWITCNIGYHHIHHLAPRIPNYHLRAALRGHPDAACPRAPGSARQPGLRAHEALGREPRTHGGLSTLMSPG